MAEEYETQREKKKKYYNENFKSLYSEMGGSRRAHGETSSKHDKKYGHSMAYRNIAHRIPKTSAHSNFKR